MNHSLKRALALLLSLSMSGSMFPISAGATGQAEVQPDLQKAAEAVKESSAADEDTAFAFGEESLKVIQDDRKTDSADETADESGDTVGLDTETDSHDEDMSDEAGSDSHDKDMSDEAGADSHDKDMSDEAGADSDDEDVADEAGSDSHDENMADERNAGDTEGNGSPDRTVPAVTAIGTLEDITFDFSKAMAAVMAGDPAGELPVDYDDPAIEAVENELSHMKVTDEEGGKTALTEEQVQQALGMYQMYLDQWEAHADILGVQSPFYLQYNDKKDGLGMMGEMLVLAGHTVEEVRNGEYSYDDLTGMIMNFYYGDYYGIRFYGDDVVTARKKALKAVKDSGAKTEAQKLLILTTWLGQHNTFDMAYIMEEGTDSPMNVEVEVPNPHYDEIYETIFGIYQQQIYASFHDNMYMNMEAGYRQQYIQGCMEQGMEQAAAEQAADAYVKSEETAAAIEAMVKDTMDTAEDVQTGIGMTYSQEIPIFAGQAAAGLTRGIIRYWQGTQFGALALGSSVCMGYSKAFAYLVQCLYPEIYLKSGKKDIDTASNWKTAKSLYYDAKGNLDPGQNYNVDLVRITFDADVSMYGVDQNEFGSDHFWNAVKVDGTWFYIDPCYIDVFTEVMSRERVETNGSMNHMYFLFSDTTARNMYSGYFKEIKSLYTSLAKDDRYRDTWFARIKSNVYADGKYAYYSYDSINFLRMLDEYKKGGDYTTLQQEAANSSNRIVKHALTSSDMGDGDSNFTTLIDFTCKKGSGTVAKVYNPASGKMEENTELTRYYAQLKTEKTIYPSLAVTMALYDGQIYFNVSNVVFSYNLATGAVALVKEYNRVYAKRDASIAFGGMAFTVIDEADYRQHKEDTLHYLEVNNAPVAGVSLKDDGMLYVDIATNYSYISGRTSHDMYVINEAGVTVDSPDVDDSSYGYAYQESNYNSDYSTFGDDPSLPDEFLEMLGHPREKNDNDEFMWAAVFTETLPISHLAGDSHVYQTTAADPFCGRDGYTEDRCTTCGRSKAGSRKTVKNSACDHHYVIFEEKYYTRSADGNWVEGNAAVCTMCGYSITEPRKPIDRAPDSVVETYTKKKAAYDAAAKQAGHKYEPTNASWADDFTNISFSGLKCTHCSDIWAHLDCLTNDTRINNNYKDIFVTLPQTYSALTKAADVTGDCKTGLTVNYKAEGTVRGMEYALNRTVKLPAGQHEYSQHGKFIWTKEEDGSYTAVADLKCSSPSCDSVLKGVKTEVSVEIIEPDCEEPGARIYTAVAKPDGTGTVAGTRQDEIPALGHAFDASDICTRCGIEKPVPKITLSSTTKTYTGSPIASNAAETRSDGKITYIYYLDQDCTKLTTGANSGAKGNGLAPVNPGLYYVKACAAASDQYKAAESKAAVLTINPRKVTGVKAVNAAKGVEIRWKQRTEAKGYQIYAVKKGGNEYTQVAAITKNSTVSYIWKDAPAGEVYTYMICATSKDENVISDPSESVELAYVARPKTLTAANVSSGVQVNWTAVTGADKYVVYRKLEGQTSWKKMKSLKNPSVLRYTDKSADLKDGVRGVYVVKAYKGTFASAASAERAFCRLTTPAIFSVKNTASGKILVTLKSSNKAASGYKIQYGYKSDFSDAKTVKITSRSQMTKTISGLKKNKTCYIRVQTYRKDADKTWLSGWSGKKSVKVVK